MDQVIQIVGALLILAAFAAVQFDRMRPDSRLYLALNLIGSQALANKIAADEIAKANEDLPRQIDGQTRIDSIEMVAGLVIYNYTLADPSGAPSLTPLQINDLKSDRGKSLITQNYCRPDLTGPQTSPTYSARYRYRTVDGQVVLDFTLTPQACAGTTP